MQVNKYIYANFLHIFYLCFCNFIKSFLFRSAAKIAKCSAHLVADFIHHLALALLPWAIRCAFPFTYSAYIALCVHVCVSVCWLYLYLY